jgi:hypothetical protein
VGHLGYLHSLAIVNSAAVNMGVQCLCNNLSHIPPGLSLGVGLLDHMAILCLFFEGASILFSKVVVQAYIQLDFLKAILLLKVVLD